MIADYRKYYYGFGVDYDSLWLIWCYLLSWSWGILRLIQLLKFLSLCFFLQFLFLQFPCLLPHPFFLPLRSDVLSSFSLLVHKVLALSQQILFSLLHESFCWCAVVLASVEFVDDFLVEPGAEAREEIAFQRVSKESLAFQDLVGVSLQMFKVLFGEDSTDDFLVDGALLLAWFSVL